MIHKERPRRANTHLGSRRRGAEEEAGRELAPVDGARGWRERRHGHRHDRNAPARRGHLGLSSFPLTLPRCRLLKARVLQIPAAVARRLFILTVSHQVAAPRLGRLARHQLSIPHRPMVHSRTTR
jgi:hypothetical protein